MENEKFQELVLGQLKELIKSYNELKEDMVKGYSELKRDISELKATTTKLERDLLRLETRMENELIEKVRALFDARSVHEDKLDQVQETIQDRFKEQKEINKTLFQMYGEHEAQIRILQQRSG